MRKILNKYNVCILIFFVTALLIAVMLGKTVFAIRASSETVPVEAPPSDTEPPVISASDFEITEGDTVSYKKHMSVTDDTDEDPIIEIDNSKVDTDTPGQYEVTYTATDHSGNMAVAWITLTVRKKVYTFDENAEAWLSQEAQAVLQEILTDDMNDMQKGYAIYRWTKKHISYADSSYRDDYRIAARNGFLKRRGDCFTYFAVSKVLLDEAGIENIDMVKLRKSNRESRHYWSLINVGTGWYHFDCTQYVYPKSNFYMVTDKELKKWDKRYYANAHRYDPKGLPEMATKSVQSMIKYSAAKLTLPEG